MREQQEVKVKVPCQNEPERKDRQTGIKRRVQCGAESHYWVSLNGYSVTLCQDCMTALRNKHEPLVRLGKAERLPPPDGQHG